MLLALTSTALALALLLGAPSTPPPPASHLPATQPGLGHDEGVFLVTTANDGSRASYFIAGNARHSISWTDLQIEVQLNPLWPVRPATQDEVLEFPEGAPINGATTGPLATAPVAPPAPAADQAPAAPAPAPAPREPAAPAADEAPPQPTTAYTLQKGDNLTRIAAANGTTVEAILAANGVSNPNRIYAGQSLIIPGADFVAEDNAPEPPTADDPTPVAAAPVPADDETTADTPADQLYTVVRGDSAIKIARRFGIDQDSLLAANGINNPNLVYVGQVLTIPG